MKIYQFTCARCGNVSGHMSSSPLDAPTCCNGEEMYPTVAYMSERIWEVYIEGSAFPVATFAREDLACDWSGKMQKKNQSIRLCVRVKRIELPYVAREGETE